MSDKKAPNLPFHNEVSLRVNIYDSGYWCFAEVRFTCGIHAFTTYNRHVGELQFLSLGKLIG